jgi:hypothetical protein
MCTAYCMYDPPSVSLLLLASTGSKGLTLLNEWSLCRQRMADPALRSFVSDQLYALLGFAEGSLVSYIIALGASHTCTLLAALLVARTCSFALDPAAASLTPRSPCR